MGSRVVGYLLDLGKITTAKIRSIYHQLLPGNFFGHQELGLSSANYAFCVGKYSIPLERTDVIMCDCGKIFYERHEGDHEPLVNAYECFRRAVREANGDAA